MNLPPLLLGATLLFWGWQTGLPTVGAILAVLFEGTRLTKFQWDTTEDELNRLWNLVTVVFLAAAVFAFTSNEGPLAFSQMFENPGLNTSRDAGESSQKTAASLIQWMPMIFFPFLFAVTLSRQSTVTLKVLSLLARRQRPGRDAAPLAAREVHVGWVYFGVCLVSSSINNRNDESFFAGVSLLLLSALWTRRSRRFSLPLWAGVAVAACLLAYWGQGRMGQLRAWVEHFTPQWAWRVGGGRTNPDQDRTTLGQIGRLKGSSRIVVRIKPEAGTAVPTLLRTASYRDFRRTLWTAVGSQETGRQDNRFEPVISAAGEDDWTLRFSMEDRRIHIATYLEGETDVLPLPMGVSRLENLQAFTLKTNALGTVLAQGPDLVVFDAAFGADGSIDSTPTDADLYVDPKELPAIEAAVAEAAPVRQDTARLLGNINGFFQGKFQYSLWQNIQLRSDDGTPLGRFLMQDRQGHCEYFATATVLMLRKLGIPARYAVGWAVEEPSGSGYVIRERHAHAWCLYYDSADGKWHDFDTTPATWVKEESRRASMFEFLTDIWQRIKFEFTKWRSGQSRVRDYLWWVIGPMLIFLLYRLLRRKPGARRRGQAGKNERLPSRLGLDSEFYVVERKLGEFGFLRSPGETQAQFVQRALRDARLAGLHDVMFAMLQAHYRLRFDPLGLTREEREALSLGVREVVERLGHAQTK